MRFLEKDLEDILMDTKHLDLAKRGLYVPKNKLRQVRIGSYGIADIVGWKRLPMVKGGLISTGYEGRVKIYVYELKKDAINVDALFQAIGYCKGIQRYMRDYRGFKYKIIFNLHLVGSSIDLSSTLCYMPDLIKYNEEFNIEFTLYNYDFDGISFEEVIGYSLKNEKFS